MRPTLPAPSSPASTGRNRARRWAFSAVATLAAFGLSLILSLPAAAVEPVFTATFSDVAIRGYDAVAYFTEGKAVEGREEHSFEWKGAEWHFASAENKDLFAADPEKYAPQYGGYCAWAVAQGKTASTDPEAWKIVDGKLYLNYNRKIQEKWQEDVPGNVAKADESWPKILADD